MITGKINVLKINKEKLFKGEKGTYLDIVIIETPNSEYGDYMIKQSGKMGEDMPILGNAKNFKAAPGGSQIKPNSAVASAKLDKDDDLPF